MNVFLPQRGSEAAVCRPASSTTGGSSVRRRDPQRRKKKFMSGIVTGGTGSVPANFAPDHAAVVQLSLSTGGRRHRVGGTPSIGGGRGIGVATHPSAPANPASEDRPGRSRPAAHAGVQDTFSHLWNPLPLSILPNCSVSPARLRLAGDENGPIVDVARGRLRFYLARHPSYFPENPPDPVIAGGCGGYHGSCRCRRAVPGFPDVASCPSSGSLPDGQRHPFRRPPDAAGSAQAADRPERVEPRRRACSCDSSMDASCSASSVGSAPPVQCSARFDRAEPSMMT